MLLNQLKFQQAKIQLLQTIIYSTTKPRRTFTPLLIQNPNLTSRGILPKHPSRSYKYNLPEELPNKHLYYHNTEANRIKRTRYNRHKLQKLGIPEIHQNGIRTYNRSLPQILKQLSSKDIIRGSMMRAFENITQVINRFPQQVKQQRDIIKFALTQLHDRHLAAMGLFQFSMFCKVAKLAKFPPTTNVFTHFYKFIQGQQKMKSNKLKLDILCRLTNYVFRKEYPDFQEILYKTKINFKIFEDNPGRIKSFEQLIPTLYSEQYMAEIRSSEYRQRYRENAINPLKKIPGGKILFEKIFQTPLE